MRLPRSSDVEPVLSWCLAADEVGTSAFMGLATSLVDCAERCEHVIRGQVAYSVTRSDAEFRRAMLLAIAAMQTAATSSILDGAARADALLLVVRSTVKARQAIDDRWLLDPELRHCAACCERAAALSSAALAASAWPE
jgi:hypothetical protein